MERVWYNCKPIKTWPDNESINQRSSQEAHGKSGGAAAIHSSGWTIDWTTTVRWGDSNFLA
ncbi:hypothetical protein EXN66_Car018095 [Channa argus]|uniref:Uncharacterized protein n=1 Tax=Channa argus TaxID=215402 RepID=A0A6G1QIW3_CHAAH|nr:hypothetical protein EXN66_Car018095 [Channa argus]